ncbi:uncharacterized protein LOC144382542 isoform X2 [Halichoerus grypus]
MCSFLKARDVVKNLIWTEGKQNDSLEFTLKMAPQLSGIQTLVRIVTFVVGLQPATKSRVPPAECGPIKFLCGLSLCWRNWKEDTVVCCVEGGEEADSGCKGQLSVQEITL